MPLPKTYFSHLYHLLKKFVQFNANIISTKHVFSLDLFSFLGYNIISDGILPDSKRPLTFIGCFLR